MPVIFLFISPVELDEGKWLAWRHSAQMAAWPPKQMGEPYGGDTRRVESPVAAETPDDSMLTLVESAILSSRFNPGMMNQLPAFASRIQSSFEPTNGIGVAVSAWALASRQDGLALVTAVSMDTGGAEPPLIIDQAGARQRYDVAAFADAPRADVVEAASFARALGLDAGSAAISREATQLLCLVETSKGIPESALQIHYAEEGDASNSVTALDLEHSLGSYFHIGWSTTTAIGPDLRTLTLLAPIAIRAQAIWFTEHELRTRIAGTDFEHPRQKRQSTNDMLLRFQEMRFELHLWDSEIEAYQSGLVPWQSRIFTSYQSTWDVSDTFAKLTRLVDNACELLRSTAERFDGVVETRQANILAIIAIIQLVGIPAAIVGYFDLAKLSRLDFERFAHTPSFVMMVTLLPVITGLAIVGLIAVASRRR